jgi:hypothetical protein
MTVATVVFHKDADTGKQVWKEDAGAGNVVAEKIACFINTVNQLDSKERLALKGALLERLAVTDFLITKPEELQLFFSHSGASVVSAQNVLETLKFCEIEGTDRVKLWLLKSEAAEPPPAAGGECDSSCWNAY